MNRDFRIAIVLTGLVALVGCGTYQKVTLYAPSTVTRSATFDQGDGCAGPTFNFGPVLRTPAAIVYADVRDSGEPEKPTFNLTVIVKGSSSFRFSNDKLAITGDNMLSGSTEAIKMEVFRFSASGARAPERDFNSLEDFIGPPRSSFRPYYPHISYENTEWHFSSKTRISSLSKADGFSIQIPSAVVDGETLSFPVITFHRKEVIRHDLCLK